MKSKLEIYILAKLSDEQVKIYTSIIEGQVTKVSISCKNSALN